MQLLPCVLLAWDAGLPASPMRYNGTCERLGWVRVESAFASLWVFGVDFRSEHLQSEFLAGLEIEQIPPWFIDHLKFIWRSFGSCLSAVG